MTPWICLALLWPLLGFERWLMRQFWCVTHTGSVLSLYNGAKTQYIVLLFTAEWGHFKIHYLKIFWGLLRLFAYLKVDSDELTGFCRSGSPLHTQAGAVQRSWDCLVGLGHTWTRTSFPTHTDCSQSNRERPQTPARRQDSHVFINGSMHTTGMQTHLG